MKALGRKNFVSAGKVVLPSLWKMRMPEIYNIPEQKKYLISLSESSSDTAAALTDYP